MDSGVATRPIVDFAAYRERLARFVYRSQMLMKPVFDCARRSPKRVVYAEGEDERVLRAVQAVLQEGLAKPILIGRPQIIARRCEVLGLKIRIEDDFDVLDPESYPAFEAYWQIYHRLMERRGVSPDAARAAMRTNTTAIAAVMLRQGEAEAMICGTWGQYGGAPAPGAERHRAQGGRHRGSAERADPAVGHLLLHRHLRQPGPGRRADRRDHPARGRRGAPLRHHAEGGADQPLQLRQCRDRLGAQDAGSRPSPARARARPRGRRRDARRRCAERAHPRPHLSQLAAARAGPTCW